MIQHNVHFPLIFLGSNTRIELKVEKSTEGPDYILKFNLGTLNVNNFLAKFEVDASQMIRSDLNFASSRMGLATLIMQEPQVDGLFSPGGGFEITATGKIAAPELPADAAKFYIIVQSFKEGASDSVNGGYGKPIAAVFALYESMILFQIYFSSFLYIILHFFSKIILLLFHLLFLLFIIL